MSSQPPTIFLTAAEHSGDALGAALIEAIKKQQPEAVFVGVGGEKMAAAGCRLLANPVKRSAMLGQVLSQAAFWRKLLKDIQREIAALKPDVVVPIDSSFINLRIATLARSVGVPVCYYVAPQVWASRPWRVKKIKRCVNTLCCILPFEETYFKRAGVNAIYVGHPMFDAPVDTPETDPAAVEPPLPGLKTPEKSTLRIAVFPGSRKAEIAAHMPAMLDMLSEIRGKFPQAQFVAAAPSDERAWQIRHCLRGSHTPVEIRVNKSDAIIRWADFVLTKSGTATLQIARHHKPMVVMFAVPWWQWHLIARFFINTKFIALVNILAGRMLVPEFVPFHGSPLPVARACIELLGNAGARASMSRDLAALVAPLQPSGGLLAADRVANEVLKFVQR